MATHDKIHWGVSAGFHDASISVVQGDQILFAGHSERYSRIKNDKNINFNLVQDAMKYGRPDIVHWYENPYKKALRRLIARQDNIWTSPRSYLKGLSNVPIKIGDHHESHASAGFYTSGFDEAAVLVVDAIGEFTTISISHYLSQGDRRSRRPLYRTTYPRSLGLFYSAITDRVGLKANEDEYILMGMAAYGDPLRFYDDVKKLYNSTENFHRGCKWFLPDLEEKDYFDLAASAQKFFEAQLEKLLSEAVYLTKSRNLVYMGGCALNCVANGIISKYFDNHWIMPNPGDAGSSLGAITAHTRQMLDWKGPYLGYDIARSYPTEDIVRKLQDVSIVGVANGRAEFGPRALGNRSLFGNALDPDIKDKMNKIKRRQEFRPFAPVIMKEHAADYFDVEKDFESAYMQHVVRCTQPEKFPGIVHKDGTSRVQTVTRDQHRGLYDTLALLYKDTGCPMMLNTSLNIKGQPMVNDIRDATEFSTYYGISVLV